LPAGAAGAATVEPAGIATTAAASRTRSWQRSGGSGCGAGGFGCGTAFNVGLNGHLPAALPAPPHDGGGDEPNTVSSLRHLLSEQFTCAGAGPCKRLLTCASDLADVAIGCALSAAEAGSGYLANIGPSGERQREKNQRCREAAPTRSTRPDSLGAANRDSAGSQAAGTALTTWTGRRAKDGPEIGAAARQGKRARTRVS